MIKHPIYNKKLSGKGVEKVRRVTVPISRTFNWDSVKILELFWGGLKMKDSYFLQQNRFDFIYCSLLPMLEAYEPIGIFYNCSQFGFSTWNSMVTASITMDIGVFFIFQAEWRLA